MQKLMKILEKPISTNGGEKLTSLQRDFLVNPSAQQEKEKAQQMTVTSGRKCCEHLTKFGPLGLLARMLLESPQWYCPVRKLQWQAVQIYSERITYKQKQQSSSSLSESVKILKKLDTNCSRLLFRLAVLRPLTGETGYGSSRIISQVNTQKTTGKPINYRDFRPVTSISLVKMKIQKLIGQRLLPTPVASSDSRGGCTRPNVKWQDATLAHLMHSIFGMPGKISHLSPLYVSEMMGYPTNYLLLPFQSGARRQ